MAKATHTENFTGETEYMKQFTDADFQYSAAQFDTDYLEGISSQENADPSGLSRESLFVKFDPLVGKSAALADKVVSTATKLNEIYESDEMLGELPEAGNITSVTSQNLLMMDTPPKKTTPSNRSNQQGHPLTNSHTTPVDLDLAFPPSHVTTLAQPANMYTEDQVAAMIENARKQEIENARKKYVPELAALEREFSELDQKPGQLYDECMYVDSTLTSQQTLLEREIAMCKRLLTEHEQLETLMVYCHEKFKEQFLAKAEQRDSTLKSEKFKVKSFEELLQRYLKLQEASKKLHKYGLSTLKNKSNEMTQELKKFSEDCLLKQDGLNLSNESVQKEISSKLAVERAQTRTIEMQVRSLQSALEQKEQEKQELTQIAEQLMKGLRNSG